MDTLVLNPNNFNGALKSIKTFAETIFSGKNENQKHELFGMLKTLPNLYSHMMNILPPEMLEKVLKYLNYEKICQARLVCRQWKDVIDNGNIIGKVSGKILRTCSF